MTNNVRVVIDTNVAVSAALLPRSVPRQAFDRALEQGIVLISSATVVELHDVLRRPQFDKYVHEDERLAFLATLVREAELVVVTDVVTTCRDPKDNKFLELALSGEVMDLLTSLCTYMGSNSSPPFSEAVELNFTLNLSWSPWNVKLLSS